MWKKMQFMNHSKKIFYISITIILIFLIAISIIFGVGNIREYILNKQKEEIKEISYQITNIDGNKASIVITFNSENGINNISYQGQEDQIVLNCNGKNKVAIDYEVEDEKSYNFSVEYADSNRKELNIDFKIPRIEGTYSLNHGVYVNEPDLTGFIPEKTRYLCLDENGNLNQNNWIVNEKPEEWYDYKNQKWANIYVEDEGAGSYYVWIPRYCYKLADDERTDVKFINVYNEYIDPVTNQTKNWEELKEEGYKIPEAFCWSSQFDEHAYNKNMDIIIPGYWMSKYQLNELTSYEIDYSAIVNKTSIEVTNLKININEEEIAKYVYALDGVVYDTQEGESSGYTFEDVEPGNKVVNVTALNSNDEIIASMTKRMEIATPNEPDTDGFDKDTTFYVYWDEDGNEHNETPLSKDAPAEWYNYSTATWANIVTRNDGLETYYVWIPRYAYKLNQISQRTYVKFLEGTTTQTDEDYKIPEAFTFDGKELTGYWITKYQLAQEEKDQLINAEMSAGSNLIRIKDITGTLIEQELAKETNIKYEYYLNGNNIHNGTNNKENYTIDQLEPNTTYTVNIIARNKDTDEYIGAVTKKITTVDANAPDISSFDENSTYYVYYEGEEEKQVSIKDEEPENWYDYSNQKWANIVTKNNNTETYFVWIPRYEYKILNDRTNLSTANRRIDVTFISTDITNSNCSNGYKVPEAFTFDGKELPGYWITKYQLNNN